MQRGGYNLRGDKLWQDHEDKIIAQFYPDYKAITEALPHRTFGACKRRARVIHVAKTVKVWKASEIALLRRIYPKGTKEELLTAFPDSNWEGICHMAWNHKFYRARRPYKLTGSAILDQVRARCWELRLTMRDLDRIVRGAGYFTKKHWRGPRGYINHKLVARAAKKLFGDLKIEWK